jgi:hypothetical protein
MSPHPDDYQPHWFLTIPVDYKSTGFHRLVKPENNQLQLDSYAWILRENGFKPLNKGYLVYYVGPVEVVSASEGSITTRWDVQEHLLDVDPDRAKKVFDEAVDVLMGGSPLHADRCGFGRYLQRNRFAEMNALINNMAIDPRLFYTSFKQIYGLNVTQVFKMTTTLQAAVPHMFNEFMQHMQNLTKEKKDN